MDFYNKIEKALFSSDINTKELIISQAIEFCKSREIEHGGFKPKIAKEPSYAAICKIVPPKELPKRKDFSSKEGLVALAHAIAHIEYSAIDLALDAVYRFLQMPKEFKLDWLVVAEDEVRHFKMLHAILEELGAKYGDLPVHKGLFEMANKTALSVLDRMAVIPRYFEAGGLDVNPKISAKLFAFRKNPVVVKILEALDIIYKEEIDHVRKGDKWFKYICDLNGYDYRSKYKEIISKYNLAARASQFDINGRKQAGFSCEELIDLGAKEC